MKKLVLFAAVALSMSVFSCGNGEKGEATDSVADTANVEAPADTTAATDSVAPVDSAAVAEQA